MVFLSLSFQMGLRINVLHFPLGCWILCVFRERFGLSSDGKNIQTYQLPQSLSWGLMIPVAVLGADWSGWREGKASPLPFLSPNPTSAPVYSKEELIWAQSPQCIYNEINADFRRGVAGILNIVFQLGPNNKDTNNDKFQQHLLMASHLSINIHQLTECSPQPNKMCTIFTPIFFVKACDTGN